MTVTRIFTFGFAHRHPTNGRSLKNMYVSVTGKTGEHCRMEMLNRFGQQWAFRYDSPELAGVQRFGLTELPVSEWPPSSGEWAVDDNGNLVENY